MSVGALPDGLGRVLRAPMLGASVRVFPRTVVTCVALTAIATALFVLSLGTGTFAVPPGQVVATLLGGGDQATSFVIETLRLPRALTAVLVGVALGAAGAIFQSVTRNPLGSPDIIGFTSGASVGAVLQIIVFGGGGAAVAGGALAGGAVTAALMYVLAFRDGVEGYRLILVGIAVSAMLYALIKYLIVRARLEDAQAAAVWLNGSLNGRGWPQVWPAAGTLALLLPLVALLARPLRMMELGDDASRALGVDVQRARLALIAVGVGLTATAAATAGPIAFVALAAPQIARRITGAAGPGVGAAALMGVVLLLGCDLLSQRVLPETQLPVGILTGTVGGLYLACLLAHEWRTRAR